jgi:hypothetical protein
MPDPVSQQLGSLPPGKAELSQLWEQLFPKHPDVPIAKGPDKRRFRPDQGAVFPDISRKFPVRSKAATPITLVG